MVLEFTDPVLKCRRSATYLPEVAEQEGKCGQHLECSSLSCRPHHAFYFAHIIVNSCRFAHFCLLLPGWTKLVAIDSLVRKSGYSGPITDSFRTKLRITRYQSSLYTMTFADYSLYVKKTRGTKGLVC